mmetsp:Transcript_36543/g.103989  ORF Transcript_36543/g.103989 Transcript_36543/m.103989 type:complete len:231 (-) Transcript_36543:34-726(-)
MSNPSVMVPGCYAHVFADVSLARHGRAWCILRALIVHKVRSMSPPTPLRVSAAWSTSDVLAASACLRGPHAPHVPGVLAALLSISPLALSQELLVIDRTLLLTHCHLRLSCRGLHLKDQLHDALLEVPLVLQHALRWVYSSSVLSPLLLHSSLHGVCCFLSEHVASPTCCRTAAFALASRCHGLALVDQLDALNALLDVLAVLLLVLIDVTLLEANASWPSHHRRRDRRP